LALERPKYAESEEIASVRAFKMRQHINDTLVKNYEIDGGSSVCFLIISHGFFVNSASYMFRHETKIQHVGKSYYPFVFNNSKDELKKVLSRAEYQFPDYCAINAFKIEAEMNEGKTTLDGFEQLFNQECKAWKEKKGN